MVGAFSKRAVVRYLNCQLSEPGFSGLQDLQD